MPDVDIKVLVTGATGMVGSELVRQLVAEGVRVRILRRETSSLQLLQDLATEVDHAVGDVRDAAAVNKAVEGTQFVYHTAAYLGFSGKRDRARLHSINVGGTANVVNAALRHGVHRLVHTSSMAAFGRSDRPGGIYDETSTWQTSRLNTRYAWSKYLSELEVQRGVAEGLDAVIVNPALVFGKARPGENTLELVQKIRNGSIPGYPGGGTNVVDVLDVAAGHRLAMLNGRTGDRYFLGSENLSWAAIFKIIADAFDVAPPRWPVPRRVAIGLSYYYEALARITGKRPTITRETARASAETYIYSNRKAVEKLGCSFRPFTETAGRLARDLT